MEVVIQADAQFERALKRFTRLCQNAGILSDVRRREHYEKPSERRKRKLTQAVRKTRRARA